MSPKLVGWDLAASDRVDYAKAIQKFEETIRGELQRGAISGVSVALVDDQRLVYSSGFGFADKARRVAAGSTSSAVWNRAW